MHQAIAKCDESGSQDHQVGRIGLPYTLGTGHCETFYRVYVDRSDEIFRLKLR